MIPKINYKKSETDKSLKINAHNSPGNKTWRG